MNKQIVIFVNIGNNKCKFYFHKNQISLDDVDIDKILRSGKVSSVKKGYIYFIGHKDGHCRIKPLCKMFPKTSRYAKSFNEANYVPF